MTSPTYKTTWVHGLAGYIGAAYLFIVDKTSFVVRRDHPAALELRRRRQRAIYAFWHNSQVFLAREHRGEGVHILVSQSRDGEYIAQVMNRVGLKAARGSSSRGGLKAILALNTLLERGEQIGFTPDGPRGPARSVAGGIVMAATRTGAPILPVHAVSRRQLTFNTWDKFMLPLPFSVIAVAHAQPFTLSPEQSEKENAEAVRLALNNNAQRCEELERQLPPYSFFLLGAGLGALYNIFSHLLFPLWMLLLVFKFGLRRSMTGWKERLGAFRRSRPDGTVWWFHAASIGEWQALKPLLRELGKTNEASAVISVSTPEAEELIGREAPEWPVTLLPIDFPWAVRRWLNHVKPDAMFLVETELWPNVLRTLYERYVPVYIVNGRLSKKSVKYWSWARPFIQRVLNPVNEIYARTEADAEGFHALGVPSERIHVVGNLKNDNLTGVSWAEKKSQRLALWKHDDGVYLVGGSTRGREEEMLLSLFQRKFLQRLRLVLAPRHMGRMEEVARLIENAKISWSRWSKIKPDGIWTTDVLLVDTLGDLNSLYQAGDMAFVGGSLDPNGGQNPLEPAAARLAMVFGSSMSNFSFEAANLLNEQAARQATTSDEIKAALEQLMTDAPRRREMGEAAWRVVEHNKGVAARTMAAIKRGMEI